MHFHDIKRKKRKTYKKPRVKRTKDIPLTITFNQNFPVNQFYDKYKKSLDVNIEIANWQKDHPQKNK